MLDDLIRNRYDHFVKVARNILAKKKKYNEIDTRSHQMVSEAYMHVTKLSGTDSFLESCLVNHMHKQVNWSNGKVFEECSYAPAPLINKGDDIFERPDPEYVPIDLVYEENHAQLMDDINSRIERLNYTDSILFKMAIVGTYSNSGRLSEELNIPRTTAYYMIRDLKRYLADE